MQITRLVLLAAELSSVLALPAPSVGGSALLPHSVGTIRRSPEIIARKKAEGAAEAAKPAAGNATEGAKEGEAGEAGEIEQAGVFGQPIALAGGAKVDTLFPAGANTIFEVEFQNAQGRTLTVTENKSPAAAPPGFTALETSSYIVSLAEGAEGLTLSKIDFIKAPTSAVDLSTAQIGRFCAEAGAFVVGDPALGEQEFEAEENEVLLKAKNMNGEWAVFVPQAAAATPATPATPATGGATGNQFLDLLLGLIGARQQ